MAEQNDQVLDAPSGADVEAEAVEHGWKPEPEWKGDKARWVDAKTYLERISTVLPLVQQNNKALQSTNRRLVEQVNSLTGELKAVKTSITAIEESHEADVAERIKETKADIARALKAARDDEDTEAEVKLLDQLADLKSAEKDAERAKKEKKEAPAPAKEAPPLDPAMLAWQEQNTWFGVDARKSRRAMVIAAEIAEDNVDSPLRGKAFYEEMDKRLSEFNMGSRRPADSKVESGRTRGTGGGAKSFADLPADAKAACDKQGKQLVGPNRAYKTSDAWRVAYAAKYFEGE